MFGQICKNKQKINIKSQLISIFKALQIKWSFKRHSKYESLHEIWWRIMFDFNNYLPKDVFWVFFFLRALDLHFFQLFLNAIRDLFDLSCLGIFRILILEIKNQILLRHFLVCYSFKCLPIYLLNNAQKSLVRDQLQRILEYSTPLR